MVSFVVILLLAASIVNGHDSYYHSEFDCAELDDGNYPDPNGNPPRCNTFYYACNHHVAIKITCPGDLLYDPDHDWCEKKENVVVCGGQKPTTLAPADLPETLSPDIFDCSENEDGFFPDMKEKCSNTYYACSGGLAQELHCQDGLIFDPDTMVCDIKDNVFACTGIRPTKPVSDAPLVTFATPSYPMDCKKMADGSYADPTKKCSHIFYVCSNEFISEMTCHGETYFDTKTGRCEIWRNVFDCSGQEPLPDTYNTMPNDIPLVSTLPPVNFDCTDMEDGPHPDTDNKCSQHYYVCSNHIAHEQTCPGGTYFDPAELVCDGYGNIHACTGVSKSLTTTTEFVTNPPRIPDYECTGKADGFYVDPENDCSDVYYVCSKNIDYKIYCPEGLRFHLESEMCDHFDNVFACSGKYPEPSTLPTPADVPVTEALPIDCKGKADGDYPDPEKECSETYYSCSGGVATKRTCADTTFFDPELLVCEIHDNVPVCSGKPREEQTPTPPHKDAETYPFDCSKNEDGNYAVGTCESYYWSCVGGITFKIDCPEGLMFDFDRNKCEVKSYIPKCGGSLPTPAPPADATSPQPDFPVDCSKLMDGTYPDPDEVCSKIFYVCVAGRTSKLDCPANLAFDADRNICDLRVHILACGGKPIDQGSYNAPQTKSPDQGSYNARRTTQEQRDELTDAPTVRSYQARRTTLEQRDEPTDAPTEGSYHARRTTLEQRDEPTDAPTVRSYQARRTTLEQRDEPTDAPTEGSYHARRTTLEQRDEPTDVPTMDSYRARRTTPEPNDVPNEQSYDNNPHFKLSGYGPSKI